MDLKNTVVVAVDLLEQFFGHGCNPNVPPSPPDVRTNATEFINNARGARIPVVHSLLRFTPEQAVISPMSRLCGPICVAGDPGAELITGLASLADAQSIGDRVVFKQTYDGFAGTVLEATLHDLGATRLLMCGVQTHVCVMHTALAAFLRGFEITVIQDCCGSPCPEDHGWALRHMQHFAGAQIINWERLVPAFRERSASLPRE